MTWCQVAWGGENDLQESVDLMGKQQEGGGDRKGEGQIPNSTLDSWRVHGTGLLQRLGGIPAFV